MHIFLHVWIKHLDFIKLSKFYQGTVYFWLSLGVNLKTFPNFALANFAPAAEPAVEAEWGGQQPKDPCWKLLSLACSTL